MDVWRRRFRGVERSLSANPQ